MRQRDLILVFAAAILVPLLPAAGQAQDGFMLGLPKAQLTVRAGPMLHRAGGDLFDYFQSELTLDRGDFRAPAVSADASLVMHPRVDVSVSAGWSSMEQGSEFREFVEEVDGEDVPIEQTTALRVIPLTIGAKFYPLARGRSISEYAWVPASTTPYIGGGAGFAWYKLQQYGDFVAAEDLSIFTEEWESTGRTAIAHVFAGVDHWFTPRAGLNLEGRYTFGSAKPDDDFIGWNSVDLSGLQVGVGLALRW